MPPTEAPRRSGSTRALPRALMIAALVLLAARIAGVALRKDAEPGSGAGPPRDRVTWVPVAEADAIAAAEGKPLLYDFTAEWCPPCHLLDRAVFEDSAAATWISRRFVPVRVVDRLREEGRNAPAVDSLQRAFGVQAFPTLVVAWPGGGPSDERSGFAGKRETMAWLASAAAEVKLRAIQSRGMGR